MLGFKDVLKTSMELRTKMLNYQTVRWRRPRKPFYLGVAKSKMFIVPKPKEIPSEVKDELSRLTDMYKMYFKSILQFLQKDNIAYQENLRGQNKSQENMIELEKKISESLEKNEIWNKNSAKQREIREKVEIKNKQEEILEELLKIEEAQRKVKERVEEIVRREKEFSKSYITPENIDEAIEHCLNNVMEYNFAIDLKGKKYPGKQPFMVAQKDNLEENAVSN